MIMFIYSEIALATKIGKCQRSMNHMALESVDEPQFFLLASYAICKSALMLQCLAIKYTMIILATAIFTEAIKPNM